jgi:hypothetical protein
MYNSDGTPLFPFYWSPNPRLVKGPNTAHLSPFEMETVAFLNSFDILSTKELVRLETSPSGVVEYLSKYYPFVLTCLFHKYLDFSANFILVFCFHRENEDDF